jgi:hypothetical protein
LIHFQKHCDHYHQVNYFWSRNLFNLQIQHNFLNEKKHFEFNKTSFFFLTHLFQIFLETIEPTESNAKEIEQRCEVFATETLSPLLLQYEKIAEREIMIGILPLYSSIKALSSHCQSLLIKTYSNEILENGFPDPSPFYIDHSKLTTLLKKYKPSDENYQIRFVLFLSIFQNIEDIHIATSPINTISNNHPQTSDNLKILIGVIISEFTHWKSMIIQHKNDLVLSSHYFGMVQKLQ